MKYTLSRTKIKEKVKICYTRNTSLRHSTRWEHDVLINQSKYMIESGRNLPLVSCNKSCCFEHLRTALSIRCYFYTINLKQYGFCTAYPLIYIHNIYYKYIHIYIHIYIYIYIYIGSFYQMLFLHDQLKAIWLLHSLSFNIYT